jgi:hypothetical protein
MNCFDCSLQTDHPEIDSMIREIKKYEIWILKYEIWNMNWQMWKLIVLRNWPIQGVSFKWKSHQWNDMLSSYAIEWNFLISQF